MADSDPLIRNISDTARWSAVYRARESERPDALFRDPFAGRLAGERGGKIADSMPDSGRQAWAWVTRTWLFDHYIADRVRQGADLVINLAAGLDARPYRMDLPSSLTWIEVDLPPLLEYKATALAGERPRCALERIPLDLGDTDARRRLFDDLARRSRNALVITEGLLIYLSADEVGALARDLAAPGFRHWVLEVASPGLLKLLRKQIGAPLSEAGAPLKFGPEEGPGFFERYGWRVAEVRSMLKTAAQLKRLSLGLRILALLPDSTGRQGSRPWSGVCLLENRG